MRYQLLIASFFLAAANSAAFANGRIHSFEVIGEPLAQMARTDIASMIDSGLQLTDSQKVQIDPIAKAHQDQIEAIRGNAARSKSAQRAQIVQNLRGLKGEITRYLTPRQLGKVDSVLGLGTRKRLLPDLGASSSVFFPEGAAARSIFGNSVSSVGLGIGDAESEIGRPLRFGYSASAFSLQGNGNNLFTVSPLATAEYRAPITNHLYGFARLEAGPTFMDYSLNAPSGAHLGAKRFGASGDFEVGLKYGQLRLGIQYRAFTQPAGFDFNGLEAEFAWVVVRF